ncbi:T9SS type A sorting domain-containing protein, partial [Pontibacter sp. H259]|uniref:T9SS type A sorting domain-containing protein n=1 Tax=Pontibacter sp. H259 TaxID=3133421 RepID=UPI0030C5860D
SPYLNTNQPELNFTEIPLGSSQTKEYEVNGLGLTNGQNVTITLSPTSPYTISRTADASGFSKTLTLTGVANNRLNPTVIFVKYTPTAPGENPDIITHAQGSISKALNVRVVAPLPVELKSFTANYKEGNVVLEWSTASESNNSHFEIEMASADVNSFRKVGEVKSKVGNSSTTTNYTFNRYTSNTGQTEYYRLKQVDLDGTSAYSKIVAVKPMFVAKPMQVAPNPLKLDSKVYISTKVNGKAILRVTSLTGKQVYFEQLNLHEGHNEIPVTYYNNLKAGVYIVTVDYEDKREAIRVLKK